jgi:predicted transcriptional regulator
MDNARLPLSSLLSQALVAFTIEFDNEFEHQMPHRTTRHGATPGSSHSPWLVSMVMWSNFMQFIPSEGLPLLELKRQTNLENKSLLQWLTRLGKWWNYLVVEPPIEKAKTKQALAAAVVRLTPAGLRAREVWLPLTASIESRWRGRFGQGAVSLLRKSLQAVVSKLDVELPDYLPILGYGLFTKGQDYRPVSPAASAEDKPAFALPALLAKVLLAFALEFESEAEVSLAISANILRLIADEAVRVRNIPAHAGVSKEAVATSVSFLQKRGYAILKNSGPRVRLLILTAKGKKARETYHQLLAAIEARWQKHFGGDTIRALRESLENLVGDPAQPQQSPLFRGLKPYPDGWRAAVPSLETLPHYPMVLHRGGFPDGS